MDSSRGKFKHGLFAPGVIEASERKACLELTFAGFLSKHYPAIFAEFFEGHPEDIQEYSDIIMTAIVTSSLNLKDDLLPLTEKDKSILLMFFQEDSPLDSFARYQDEYIEFLRTEC